MHACHSSWDHDRPCGSPAGTACVETQAQDYGNSAALAPHIKGMGCIGIMEQETKIRHLVETVQPKRHQLNQHQSTRSQPGALSRKLLPPSNPQQTKAARHKQRFQSWSLHYGHYEIQHLSTKNPRNCPWTCPQTRPGDHPEPCCSMDKPRPHWIVNGCIVDASWTACGLHHVCNESFK
jgi:hypothetical protein